MWCIWAKFRRGGTSRADWTSDTRLVRALGVRRRLVREHLCGRGLFGPGAASLGDMRVVRAVGVRRRRCLGGGNICRHTPCLGYGRVAEIDAGRRKHKNAHMSPNNTSILSFLEIQHKRRYFCLKHAQQCHLGQKLVIHRPCTELQGELNLDIYYQIYRPTS